MNEESLPSSQGQDLGSLDGSNSTYSEINVSATNEPIMTIPIDGERHIDFAVRMLNRYLNEKSKDSVGVRRLHYYIVSLPERDRVMAGKKKGTVRLYQNTPQEYQNLSSLLVDARMKGLVQPDQVIDEKNVPLFEMPDREESDTTWEITTPQIRQLPDLLTEPFPDFPTWLNQFRFEPIVSVPRFVNQTHRIVVGIEKATSKDQLQDLCENYGADLLIFSGQPSVTRIYDVATRAEDEDKPIHLLYISDLDCGGWDMPTAFFKRVAEIYPHPDHTMTRIALTRPQAQKHDLPSAFDPDDKGYSQTQKDRFIQESGGRECIELDALDEDVLLDLLKAELEKVSGLSEDEEDYTQACGDAQNDAEQMDLLSI
ncbi:MAG: hypothetical protein NTV84_00950, partial [Methanoregula sp.]|nr:hypothetical protein [Methanoregula sp.]